MIGLSLLSSGHPKIFQHQLVRPSAPRYRGFGLPKDRSPGFGSAAAHWTRHSHSLSLRLRHLRLNLARSRRLAGSLCKRHAVTPNGAPTVRGRMISGSLSLPSKGFFSPFPHGTRALSVGSWYLALWNGLHGFGRGFTCPALLGIPLDGIRRSAHGAVTLCGATFQMLALPSCRLNGVPQPRRMNPPVWALPRSLATTCGISVDFFSSGY